MTAYDCFQEAFVVANMILHHIKQYLSHVLTNSRIVASLRYFVTKIYQQESKRFIAQTSCLVSIAARIDVTSIPVILHQINSLFTIDR